MKCIDLPPQIMPKSSTSLRYRRKCSVCELSVALPGHFAFVFHPPPIVDTASVFNHQRLAPAPRGVEPELATTVHKTASSLFSKFVVAKQLPHNKSPFQELFKIYCRGVKLKLIIITIAAARGSSPPAFLCRRRAVFLLPFPFAKVSFNFRFASLFNNPGFIFCLVEQLDTGRIQIWFSPLWPQSSGQGNDFHRLLVGRIHIFSLHPPRKAGNFSFGASHLGHFQEHPPLHKPQAEHFQR